MFRELVELFRQFLQERREVILKEKLLRRWAKDENFEAASELFRIFTNSNSDTVIEIDVPGKFKIRFFRDMNGEVARDRISEDEMLLGHRP